MAAPPHIPHTLLDVLRIHHGYQERDSFLVVFGAFLSALKGRFLVFKSRLLTLNVNAGLKLTHLLAISPI